MDPILTDEADLSWEYPRNKGSNESGDVTDSEVEELGIRVTTMDIDFELD
jgi:hypothetical protein